jgi:hypothetical protein
MGESLLLTLIMYTIVETCSFSILSYRAESKLPKLTRMTLPAK